MLQVRRWFWMSVMMVSAMASGSHALPTPAAPKVEVTGTPGNASAAYWVVAADGPLDKGGQLTNASPARVVSNLPGTLSEQNAAVVNIEPVPGASMYYVLKTHVLPEPAPVKIEVKNPGTDTYYYWIEPQNGFRRGAIYGPYPAEKCGKPEGNVITWTPVPNATFYHIYRTTTPEAPVGRGHFVVALQAGIDNQLGAGMYGSRHKGTTLTDSGARYGVAGFPATPMQAPPVGEGLYLLGTTSGAPVRDIGQPLKAFIVPNVNETDRTPVTMPAAEQPSVRTYGLVDLVERFKLPHLLRPAFPAHLYMLHLNQTIDSGGHNEYQNTQPGSPGYKSYISAIAAHQTSHTASQHGMLGGYQRNYGTGDTIWLQPFTSMMGSNKDDGDEGVYAIRAHVQRGLESAEEALTADTPRGSTQLKFRQVSFTAGTGRVLLNMSQSYTAGRIRRVGNVDVHGKNTKWTKDMVGQWISFDVDTVDKHRMWYEIIDVKSETELTILARTGWSHACNLGYSRFIYDPEEQSTPNPMMTNSKALRVLPDEKLPDARKGAYIIAPGTLIGDPWREGSNINVEPLKQAWKSGDKVQLAAGPQAWLKMGRYILDGDFLPQDDVGGLVLMNIGKSRMANGAAVQIGIPGHHNFATGISVALGKSGATDGIVVTGASGWDAAGMETGSTGVHRAAYVAPANVPAMRDEQRAAPYPMFLQPKPNTTAGGQFQIRSTDHRVVLAVDNAGLQVQGALTGSAQTRGKAVFSGDGTTAKFTIRFEKALASEPFVTISSNQFAAARLAEVRSDSVIVEFEKAPGAGKDNVIVYWMAQQ